MPGSRQSSSTPKILVVVGTRPEAIKMAPVVAALRREEGVETRIALTGQHTDLVDQVLATFDMIPDYDLGIMREGQTLYEVAHACLEGMRGVIEELLPDAVLVQGDTASVCFSSLVAFFERGPRLGHVEAGLRSHRKDSPFPEEMFRRIADLLADWHFAPTQVAAANLEEERLGGAVHITGNTVVDALREVASRPGEPEDPALAEVLSAGRRLVLLTAHRRESFGEPLRRLFGAVREIADAREDTTVLYPVHPNPQVTGPARELLSGHPRVRLTGPLAYPDLVRALQRAALILTDSGGIQEEAPTFGTPVLVLREVTERPEGVLAGAVELVGTDPARVVARALAALDRPTSAAPPPNPYGDGRAGERIADIVASDLLGRPRRTRDWEGPEEPAQGGRAGEG